MSPKLYTSDNDHFGVFTGVVPFLRMQYDTYAHSMFYELLYPISGKNSAMNELKAPQLTVKFLLYMPQKNAAYHALH